MNEYLKSFIYSTPIVLMSVGLSLILGTVIAKRMARKRKRNVVLNTFLNSVIYTPHFVFAFIVYSLAGSSWFLQKNGITIIMAYTLKQTPFVILYLLPTLEKIREGEYEQLAVMGAGAFRSFMTADFPRLLPVYAEITVILTSFIYTAYEIPVLLGITYPKFLGVRIFDSYFKYSAGGREEAVTAMVIFTLALFAISGFLLFICNRYRRFIGKGGGL